MIYLKVTHSVCANFNMNLTYKNTIFLAIYHNLLSCCSDHYTVTIKLPLVLKHTSVPCAFKSFTYCKYDFFYPHRIMFRGLHLAALF